jgi:uncharacterized protein
MKLHLDNNAGNFISAHTPTQVVINQQAYAVSLLVAPDRPVADWQPRCFEEINSENIAAIADYDPEVVVLGTGARLRFPASGLTAALINRGIGVEVMDTPAACRTYNLLAADGRRVVAALLMPDA